MELVFIRAGLPCRVERRAQFVRSLGHSTDCGRQPESLEDCETDELGQAVHEDCYVPRLMKEKTQPLNVPIAIRIARSFGHLPSCVRFFPL
jgi:hypothetical protein